MQTFVVNNDKSEPKMVLSTVKKFLGKNILMKGLFLYIRMEVIKGKRTCQSF